MGGGGFLFQKLECHIFKGAIRSWRQISSNSTSDRLATGLEFILCLSPTLVVKRAERV